MRRPKITAGIAALSSALLVVGLVLPNGASATVPGVNAMISENYYNSGGGNSDSYRPYISADGRFVAFDSTASNLVASDMNNKNDVFERNLATGATSLVSTSSSGVQANDGSIVSTVSRTGRYVLFYSQASNLVDGSTTDTTYAQLYLRDTTNNTTTLLSQNSSGVTANNNVEGMDVSSDGRFVLFVSAATNLGPTVTNSGSNLYMLDRVTNTFSILNKATDGSLPNTTTWAPYGHMSCDGSLVVFQSGANLTGESTSNPIGIYLLDRRGSDRLTDVTIGSNSATLGANISCSGDYIGFLSKATNLDTSITDTSMNNYHAYAYNRVNGTFSVVDVSSSGTAGNLGVLYYPLTGEERFMQLSDNGAAVFKSPATNLASSATSGNNQIYFRNLNAGTTELLSANSSGTEGNSESKSPTIASDGKTGVYQSVATNLVTSDTNGYQDLFSSETGM